MIIASLPAQPWRESIFWAKYLVSGRSVPMAYLSLNVNFKQFAHKLLI